MGANQYVSHMKQLVDAAELGYQATVVNTRAQS